MPGTATSTSTCRSTAARARLPPTAPPRAMAPRGPLTSDGASPREHVVTRRPDRGGPGPCLVTEPVPDAQGTAESEGHGSGGVHITAGRRSRVASVADVGLPTFGERDWVPDADQLRARRPDAAVV